MLLEQCQTKSEHNELSHNNVRRKVNIISYTIIEFLDIIHRPVYLKTIVLVTVLTYHRHKLLDLIYNKLSYVNNVRPKSEHNELYYFNNVGPKRTVFQFVYFIYRGSWYS
jgi:hypothetical protein